MATLQTGGHSLRGVGPRAPSIDQRAFQLDPEVFGRAATMPARVREQIEALGESSAERDIRAATRPARKMTAIEQAQGAAELAPGARQLALQGQQRDIDQFDAQTAEIIGKRNAEIAAARRLALEANLKADALEQNQAELLAVSREEAQGAAELAPGARQLALQGQQRDIEQFPDETARQAAARRAAILAEQTKIEEGSIGLQALQQNRDAELLRRGEAIQGGLTAEQAARAEARRKLASLEGTPTELIRQDEMGEWRESFIEAPTGEKLFPTIRQTKTTQDLEAEARTLESKLNSAEALAAQRNAKAAREGRVENNFVRSLHDANTGVTTLVMVTVDENGNVTRRPIPEAPAAAPATARPGLEELRTTGPSRAPVSVNQSQSSVRLPLPAAPVERAANGMKFTVTGRAIGKYQLGQVSKHSQSGKWLLYTGGDPNNPANWQPTTEPRQPAR